MPSSPRMHKVVAVLYFPFPVLGWGFLADARFGADGCWDLGVGRFELHPTLELVLESPKEQSLLRF
jgi:hypothetical protein